MFPGASRWFVGGHWRGDVLAGISVALVLMPQSIAYARLAGLPPEAGLYAAIVAPIAAAALASSPWLQTGPVAMTSLLSFGTLVAIAEPGGAEYIKLAALLALVVGLLRVFIGFMRAGFVTYLMSEPVLIGFSSAAAILIAASQLPDAVGAARGDEGLIQAVTNAFMNPAGWHPGALAFTIFSFLIIVVGRQRLPRIPWVLVAVIISLFCSIGLGYTGPVVGEMNISVPRLSMDLPWSSIPLLIVPGAVIALVGFAEAAAISRNMAARTRTSWSADREFISQGAANIAAGFFSGMPVGGSFSRTALNFAAGGRTRAGGLIAGFTLMLMLPLTPLLAKLPTAVLAVIVITSVMKLIDLKSMLELLRISRAQAAVSLVTFLATLVMSPRVDLGIFVGIVFGVGVHLWRERRISIRNAYEDATLTLEAVGVLYFGSAPLLEDALVTELAKHPKTERLVTDLRKVGRIDYSSALILRRVVARAREAGLQIQVRPGQPPQGERILRRVFGEDADCISID